MKTNTQMRRERKRRVRNSPEWRQLRTDKYNEQNGIDPVTLRPLARGYNTHHLSQEWQYYGDLAPERFVCLNSKSHSTVHFIYDIVKREGNYDVLDRIKAIVQDMEEITQYDEERYDRRLYISQE